MVSLNLTLGTMLLTGDQQTQHKHRRLLEVFHTTGTKCGVGLFLNVEVLGQNSQRSNTMAWLYMMAETHKTEAQVGMHEAVYYYYHYYYTCIIIIHISSTRIRLM